MIGNTIRALTTFFTASELLEESAFRVDPVQNYLAKPCTLSIKDGSFVDIWYNKTTEAAEFSATVKYNSYLAVGFGSSMRYTDMIVW